jgi:tryptophan synthase alpha chain
MSRLEKRFADLQAARRRALIPFITAGDPTPAVTVPLLHRMVRAGADILELGVPFSDPMAEGPAIQKACERALVHHVSLHDVLAMVREFRSQDADTPIVLMGYLNPIEILGYENFAREAAQAGVDGVITVDLPPEEAAEYVAAFRAHGLDPVFLLAPTSTEERIQRVAEVASGFVYYVSLRGVTGASHIDMSEVRSKLEAIRKRITLPLGVGFGVKDARIAAEVARFADAVVVGSAVVNRIADRADSQTAILKDIPEFIAELRTAMDGVEVAA